MGKETPGRVLAVCEDGDTQAALSRVLEGMNLRVDFVPAEQVSSELVSEDEVCIVVLDCSGEQVDACFGEIASLKSQQTLSSPPVMLLADEQHERAAARALEAGAESFMFKPLSDGELRLRIKKLLSLYNSTNPITPRERSHGALLALTQKLVSSLDFQEVLYTIVKRIADVVQVDRVSIVMVPEQQDVGFVVATSDDPNMSHLEVDLKKYPEIQHVIATKQPLFVEDVDTHPLLDGVRISMQRAGLTALTVIPIVWEEQVRGALFVRAATRKGVLNLRQMSVCRAVVNATAIAMRNAEIMLKLREEAQSIARDRLQTERQLQSLRRYAEVFVSSEDGIAVFDSDGRVLMVSVGVSRITGYTEKELLGRRLRELIHEEDLSASPELFAGVPGEDYPKSFDVRARRKDGEVRTINCSVSSLGTTGRTILMVFRDVSDARRTRDELVKTKNFLESLIENSVDAIVATDRKGTIILYNRAAERLFGWSVSGVLHKMNAKHLYLGDGAQEVGRKLRSDKEGGVGRVGPIRMAAIHASGESFPISLTAAYIYENDIHTSNFGIFTDLRDRERVEHELALAQQRIAISEKQALIAELAGATAHELNQPLTGVMGYAELLARKLVDNPDAARAAETIYREAERMAEIVRKIGKLTKYETQSYVGKQRILDLNRASAGNSENTPSGER